MSTFVRDEGGDSIHVFDNWDTVGVRPFVAGKGLLLEFSPEKARKLASVLLEIAAIVAYPEKTQRPEQLDTPPEPDKMNPEA